jgi:hypothetical protein
MTHIRIRASLGGNIPRMSKILPVPHDAFGFLLHAHFEVTTPNCSRSFAYRAAV